MDKYRTGYSPIETVQNGVMKGAYVWMGGGLVLVMFVSLLLISFPTMPQAILGSRVLFYALISGEIGLLLTLGGAINRLSASTSKQLLLAYAALNSLTLSIIFFASTSPL